MRMADLADAPVLLVADIDRGGAFAHLYGTWALLPPEWRRRVEGFVLNKFRGDAALLEPAPADLHDRTGVPVVGTIPYVEHGLPDEEGPSPMAGRREGVRIAIVCGPYASNLDEFAALQSVASVRVVNEPGALGGADLVVLPGSKHTAADAAWLRARGLDHAVAQAAKAGTPVLGICGGLQLLGRRLDDPDGVEGGGDGLGLLDVHTTYARDKRTSGVRIRFAALPPPWSWLSGRTVAGYEIRHGTTSGPAAPALVADGQGPVAYVDGNVLGTSVHGLFEDAGVVRALTGRAPAPLESVFEGLADLVDRHLSLDWIRSRVP
jgi:adenosylcobyric acid synthase